MLLKNGLLSKMYYKVTKLNKRYTWHQHFSHRVEILRPLRITPVGPDRVRDFVMLRQWCWEQFGPSVETIYWEQLKITEQAHMSNSKWAWYINTHDNYRTFLYFADEAALFFFKLNWPVTK